MENKPSFKIPQEWIDEYNDIVEELGK